MIKLIWAQDEAGGIGKEGDIPWKCPGDMKHFAKKTKGVTVVMGRKTWDSLPFKNGLPGRKNLVVTRDPNFAEADTVRLEEVLDMNCWVIGGGEIYEHLLPHAKEVHISVIPGDHKCDTFAPTDILDKFEGTVYRRFF